MSNRHACPGSGPGRESSVNDSPKIHSLHERQMRGRGHGIESLRNGPNPYRQERIFAAHGAAVPFMSSASVRWRGG